jgi:hypothetical protein
MTSDPIYEYYCSSCAKDFPYVKQQRETLSTDLFATPYQQKKFNKHTEPSTAYTIAGVFNNRSTSEYDNYHLDAQNFGTYAIDNYGRESLTYYAGREIGVTCFDGIPTLPTDSVKVVGTSGKTHLYPISSTEYSTGLCESCGISIVTATQTINPPHKTI